MIINYVNGNGFWIVCYNDLSNDVSHKFGANDQV